MLTSQTTTNNKIAKLSTNSATQTYTTHPLQMIQDHHRGNICTRNKQGMESRGAGVEQPNAVVPTGTSAPAPKQGRWTAGGCRCCLTRHCPSWRRSWILLTPWCALKAGSIQSRGIWRCRPGRSWTGPRRGWGRQLWAGWLTRAAPTNLVHRMKHCCDIHVKIQTPSQKDTKKEASIQEFWNGAIHRKQNKTKIAKWYQGSDAGKRDAE